MKIVADIDIDLANRDDLLSKIKHIPASMEQNGDLKQHVVGVYFQKTPIDPIQNVCSIPYKEAEARGYFKVDMLNVAAYGLEQVRDEEHLNALVEKEPEWDLLDHESVVDTLFHLNGHYDIVKQHKPSSVEELAMVMAMVRPGKRYLVGKRWDIIKDEIWDKPHDNSYHWKSSHSHAYAISVVVQMNLMMEDNG